MTYQDVSEAARDTDLRFRVAGCIATLDLTGVDIYGPSRHPLAIAENYMWQIAGDQAVYEAYAYAVLNEVPNPGSDPGVVTDAMILAAVQDALGIVPPE